MTARQPVLLQLETGLYLGSPDVAENAIGRAGIRSIVHFDTGIKRVTGVNYHRYSLPDHELIQAEYAGMIERVATLVTDIGIMAERGAVMICTDERDQAMLLAGCYALRTQYTTDSAGKPVEKPKPDVTALITTLEYAFFTDDERKLDISYKQLDAEQLNEDLGDDEDLMRERATQRAERMAVNKKMNMWRGLTNRSFRDLLRYIATKK